MNIKKPPCEVQGCENYITSTGCYTYCRAWQTWFRESWHELQKNLGVKTKKEGQT